MTLVYCELNRINWNRNMVFMGQVLQVEVIIRGVKILKDENINLKNKGKINISEEE